MNAPRIGALTLDSLEDLPARCRSCVFWELDLLARSRAEEAGDTAFEKEAWLSATLLEWGSCGRVAHVEDVAAGYVVYAPPARAPRVSTFPTSPVSADAVAVLGCYVAPPFRRQGVGRRLIQAMAVDVARRNTPAVEAFGAVTPTSQPCITPVEFLLGVGFKTVRAHPQTPRLRLELRGAAGWRAEVEHALAQLLAPTGAGSPS